uniref:Uncharacterized protein n=1 Tax=Ciona savignyi TaxID=51511 RepID=H2YZP0_CIOSA
MLVGRKMSSACKSHDEEATISAGLCFSLPP